MGAAKNSEARASSFEELPASSLRVQAAAEATPATAPVASAFVSTPSFTEGPAASSRSLTGLEATPATAPVASEFTSRSLSTASKQAEGKQPASTTGPSTPFCVSSDHVLPFAGAPSQAIFTVELCCGSAGLTASLTTAGFTGIAVDHESNRHQPAVQVTKLDLSKTASWEVLDHMLQVQPIIYVHAAPPCGTASRARERKVPQALRDRGAPNPKPLRSDTFPMGLPSLKGTDLDKVEAANFIYVNMARFLRNCHKKGVRISLENPRNSYMWQFEEMRSLAALPGMRFVNFQNCMHGGKRAKWSSWLTNEESMCVLEMACNDEHEHEPWGAYQDSNSVWKFHSALEAEYPKLLCNRVAAIIKAVAQRQGVLMTPSAKKSEVAEVFKLAAARFRAAAGRQPRGKRYPEVVPEFSAVSLVKRDPSWTDSFVPSQKLDANQLQLLGMKGEFGKIIRTEVISGDVSGADAVVFEVGVYHTCDEFLAKAAALVHPFDGASGIPDDTLHAIFKLLTVGPVAVQAERVETLRYYQLMADTVLKQREEALHAAMTPSREKVMAEKRILLFQMMCEHAEYDDPELVALLVSGAKLTGEAPDCAAFPARRAAPSITEAQLMRSAKWTRRIALAKKGGSGDPATDAAVWEATCEELRRSWLSGPFTEAELTELLGSLFVVSRRFGIPQGGKVRPVDDLTASMVNPAFGSSFKVDLGGVDEIAVMARVFLEAVYDDRAVKLCLSDGSWLTGVLHSSLTVEQARDILGRTLDLESAYKQISVADSSRWTSALAIHNPVLDCNQLFVAEVLPFGATAAVFAFNRVARALRVLGTRLFLLIWGNYFDDFPQLDIAAMASDSQKVAEGFLGLLGWQVSDKPGKRKPFEKVFEALGVVVDLSRSVANEVLIRNKESRIVAMELQVADIVSTGVCSQARANSLRGVFQFAEGQLYGRVAALTMPVFKSRCLGSLPGTNVPIEMVAELQFVLRFLWEAIPRTLIAHEVRPPLLIFTDAALEGNDLIGSVGAVMIDRVLGQPAVRQFFGSEVVGPALSRLQTDSTKIITVLEVLPAVAAIKFWCDRMLHRRVFLFVDNDGARHCLINLSSKSGHIRSMLASLALLQARHPMLLWYSRVPSASNCADDPSRLQLEKLRQAGFVQVFPDLCA